MNTARRPAAADPAAPPVAGDRRRLHVFDVVAPPVPQPRPKVSTRGAFARAYYPKDHPIHEWKAAIRCQAHPHRPARPLEGPLRVRLLFHLRRPLELLRPSSPAGVVWHTKQNADLDNLEKAVLDVLTTEGWWTDDGQVCALEALKVYAAKDAEPRVRVVVEALFDAEAAVAQHEAVAR